MTTDENRSMRRASPRSLGLLLGLLLAALAAPLGCRGKVAAAPACPDAGVKPFGESCSADCECASALCFEFGEAGRACTQRCTDSARCPPGSRGQKCNKQGVCRP